MAQSEAVKELRKQLLGDKTEGKSCSVCGKPESKNSKALNEKCPAHKAAATGSLPEMMRLIEKALGDKLTDFVLRAKFNAQLEKIRADLKAARAEHDAYVPETAETKAEKLAHTLSAALEMLTGEKLAPNPDADSKGEWSPQYIADKLRDAVIIYALIIGVVCCGVSIVLLPDTTDASAL